MAVDLGVPGVGPGLRVGAGGFGTVYRAEQLGFGRAVAVKVLNAVVDQDVELRRFERERQALGSVADHPNIVSVFGWGLTADRRPYLVMEYLPGGTLASLVKGGPLSPEVAVSVTVKLARALAVAHERGVLHRDVKPENVLISAFGEPVLCDFGIARPAEGGTTHTSSVATSVSHAAPEVLEGSPPSEAGDIWALVSTFHTMLAGRPPFTGESGQESMAAVITRVLTQPPPDLRPAGVPDDVAAVVEAGLAKDPAVRLATAAVVADRLEAVMAAHGWTHQLLPVSVTELEPLPTASQQVVSEPMDTGSLITTSTSAEPRAPLADGTQVLRPASVAPRVEATASSPEKQGSKGPVWVLIGAVVVLLALLAGVVGVLAGQRTSSVAASSTTTAPLDSTTTSESTTTSTSSTTTIVTTTTIPTAPGPTGPKPSPAPAPTPVPTASASSVLEAQRASDRAAVQALSGQWVTQLSSKKVGKQGNGQIFNLDGILANYQQLSSQYSGLLLLKSDDFPSYGYNGFWVVIVSEPHTSGQEALNFCFANKIPYDDCFAKRLGSSPDNSIVYQPR